MDVQAKQNTCCFYKSVQVFIIRCGINYFVLEGGPVVFYFPEAPLSAIHLFKKRGGGRVEEIKRKIFLRVIMPSL